MTNFPKKPLPAAIASIAGSITTTAGAIGLVGVVLWFLLEPRLNQFLDERITTVVQIHTENVVQDSVRQHTHGRACATIPLTGHFVADGRPGEWVEVLWRDVVRHRADCGEPTINATIQNGNNILHTADTSISGVAVPEGTRDFRYLVQIPPDVSPGPATLSVSVSFPDAAGGAPTAFTPRWPFNILPPDLDD